MNSTTRRNVKEGRQEICGNSKTQKVADWQKLKKIRVPHSSTGKVILYIAALYEIRTKTWKIVKITRHCILVT